MSFLTRLFKRKLSPSDVKVKITLVGTVRKSENKKFPNCFWLNETYEIDLDDIPSDQANIVREILKAQEKGDIK